MKKNLLLIDDDKAIIDVISIFLNGEGFRVNSYTNGARILAKLKLAKAQILLIDFLLPGNNGAEVVKLIRKNTQTKNLPIVMISANKLSREEAMRAGVNEFINKPFDLHELLRVLNRNIN